MPTMLKRAAFAGLLSSVAVAFVALPITTQSAAAAMKKKPTAAHAMKKPGGMKKGAATAPKGAGNTGDPLNAAAGKKM